MWTHHWKVASTGAKRKRDSWTVSFLDNIKLPPPETWSGVSLTDVMEPPTKAPRVITTQATAPLVLRRPSQIDYYSSAEEENSSSDDATPPLPNDLPPLEEPCMQVHSLELKEDSPSLDDFLSSEEYMNTPLTKMSSFEFLREWETLIC